MFLRKKIFSLIALIAFAFSGALLAAESGKVVIKGSTTVLPITMKAIEAYKQASDAAPLDMLIHLQLLSAYQMMGEEELVKEEEEKILAINKAYEEMRQASQESQSEAEQTEGEPAEVEEPEAGGSVEEESAAE